MCWSSTLHVTWSSLLSRTIKVCFSTTAGILYTSLHGDYNTVKPVYNDTSYKDRFYFESKYALVLREKDPRVTMEPTILSTRTVMPTVLLPA